MRPISGVNQDLERYQFKVLMADGGPKIAARPRPSTCFRPVLLAASSDGRLSATPVDSRYHVASDEWSGRRQARGSDKGRQARGWDGDTTVSVEMNHDSQTGCVGALLLSIGRGIACKPIQE